MAPLVPLALALLGAPDPDAGAGEPPSVDAPEPDGELDPEFDSMPDADAKPDAPAEPADLDAPGPTPPPDESPPVQRPAGAAGAAAVQQPASLEPAPQPAPGPAPTEPAKPETKPKPDEQAAAVPKDEKSDKEKAREQKKKLFKGFKLFRIGLWPKIGYTHGTSDRAGIFDRDKTVESVMMGGTEPVAGEDSTQKYGGWMYGFEVDLEVFLINAWLDFHKFFRPGGMLSVLVGYDHEFNLHKRVRLDVGAGFGFMRVFLGGPLKNLYYDKDNPESVNIATAGIEGRLMVDLRFRIVGPLYTGLGGMLGYHYLFSANADEVTKEKGLHYSGNLKLGVEFALPRD